MTANVRNEMRQAFFDAWQKYKTDQPLNPLDKQVVQVIQAHPEYYPLLNDDAEAIHQDYTTADNPFLHMGLHLSVLEQIDTNRPSGIQDIYQKLSHKLDNPHRTQHLIMDVLGKIIWDAQQKGTAPDEQHYLVLLQALI